MLTLHFELLVYSSYIRLFRDAVGVMKDISSSLLLKSIGFADRSVRLLQEVFLYVFSITHLLFEEGCFLRIAQFLLENFA